MGAHILRSEERETANTPPMKITALKLLICLSVLLAGLLYFAFEKIAKQKLELVRQEGNIKALNETARSFRTTAGDYAEDARQLKLERDELELYNADLYNKVREAGVKIRELQNVTRTETIIKVDTIVKTVIVDQALTANYSDSWNDIKIVARDDSTNIAFHSKDTLDVIGSVKQKKFLFFRIGKPVQKITVSNKNPKSEIHVNFSAAFQK